MYYLLLFLHAMWSMSTASPRWRVQTTCNICIKVVLYGDTINPDLWPGSCSLLLACCCCLSPAADSCWLSVAGCLRAATCCRLMFLSFRLQSSRKHYSAQSDEWKRSVATTAVNLVKLRLSHFSRSSSCCESTVCRPRRPILPLKVPAGLLFIKPHIQLQVAIKITASRYRCTDSGM